MHSLSFLFLVVILYNGIYKIIRHTFDEIPVILVNFIYIKFLIFLCYTFVYIYIHICSCRKKYYKYYIASSKNE